VGVEKNLAVDLEVVIAIEKAKVVADTKVAILAQG
jgi:hypothetical protein